MLHSPLTSKRCVAGRKQLADDQQRLVALAAELGSSEQQAAEHLDALDRQRVAVLKGRTDTYTCRSACEPVLLVDA